MAFGVGDGVCCRFFKHTPFGGEGKSYSGDFHQGGIFNRVCSVRLDQADFEKARW